MRARPDPWRRALVRLLAAFAIALALATALQDRLVPALVPMFRAWLLVVDERYWTVDLAVVEEGGEALLRRVSAPAGLRRIGNAPTLPEAGVRFVNSAATGIVLQPAIVAVALLLAWPWFSRREIALRLLAFALLLPLLLVLDVPTMLYGFAWYEESRVLDPDGFSLLVTWADAMNAGGRFVLAILCAAACVSLAQRGCASARESSRPRPRGPAGPTQPAS
jgi:hypothetical protein